MSEAAATSRHWSEAYIGRPYVEGAFDCADLVALVLAERFARHWSPPPRARGVRGRDAQVGALATEYARPLAHGERATEGDGVLMRAAGRRRGLGHHIGLHVGIESDAWVLHCQRGVGTVLHPAASLAARGLEIQGLYRWL